MAEQKLISEDALRHFGVLGMKWGVRKADNRSNRQKGAAKAAKTRAKKSKKQARDERIAKAWSLEKRGGKYHATGNTIIKATAASWLALNVGYVAISAVADAGRSGNKYVRALAWTLGKTSYVGPANPNK